MKKTVSLKTYDKNPKKKQKRVKLDNEQTKQKTSLDLWSVKDEDKNKKLSDEKKLKVKEKENASKKKVHKVRAGKRQDTSSWFGQSTFEKSEKLWLCEKNNLVVMEPEVWDTSLKKTGSKTWFDTRHLKNQECANSQLTSLEARQSLWQGLAEKRGFNNKGAVQSSKPEDTLKFKKTQTRPSRKRKRGSDKTRVAKRKEKKNRKIKKLETSNPNEEDAKKTQKIRIYPNNKQKRILNQWFEAVRWTYLRTNLKTFNGLKMCLLV